MHQFYLIQAFVPKAISRFFELHFKNDLIELYLETGNSLISYYKFKTVIAIEYCDSWKGSVRLKLVVFIDMHHSEPWR